MLEADDLVAEHPDRAAPFWNKVASVRVVVAQGYRPFMQRQGFRPDAPKVLVADRVEVCHRTS